MVTATIAMGDNQFKQHQQKDYPDPQSLPRPPSVHEPKPLVVLSDLSPQQYVDVTARVTFVRTSERQDSLGSKVVFTGMLEDSTFRVPFVSHKIYTGLLRDTVYKFKNAYVHEFPDKGLLLVVTEHTAVILQELSDWNEYRKYVWEPKIDSIKRPIQNIALTGVITTIHENSGLVKRCNKCKSLLYEDSCPNNCTDGWAWDLRVSSKLYDSSGSIKMVLTKDIAAKILQRNLSELILLASQTKLTATESFNSQFPSSSTYSLNIPESVNIVEAVTENLSTSYRKSDKLIVTDGRNLVFMPPNQEHNFGEFNDRLLKASDPEDRKIIRRLVEKAIDISVRKITGKGKLQGIYLLEEPMKLYRCEKASLYLGFSLRTSIKQKHMASDKMEFKANVEAIPQAYVRESVLDYIKMRRENGASADSVIRHLTGSRNKVIVAPSGNYGSIVEVITRKASEQVISETDRRNLVQFWKEVYDIDIKPDEMPLLKIKMINSESTFTYPPSMVFYGIDALVITAGLQKFIEDKKSTLRYKIDRVVREAVKDIRMGELRLKFEGDIAQSNNIQSVLLQEIKEKLYGKEVKGRGSIMSVHDELWFFPNQLQFSYGKP
jgi:hypothetical protein